MGYFPIIIGSNHQNHHIDWMIITLLMYFLVLVTIKFYVTCGDQNIVEHQGNVIQQHLMRKKLLSFVIQDYVLINLSPCYLT